MKDHRFGEISIPGHLGLLSELEGKGISRRTSVELSKSKNIIWVLLIAVRTLSTGWRMILDEDSPGRYDIKMRRDGYSVQTAIGVQKPCLVFDIILMLLYLVNVGLEHGSYFCLRWMCCWFPVVLLSGTRWSLCWPNFILTNIVEIINSFRWMKQIRIRELTLLVYNALVLVSEEHRAVTLLCHHQTVLKTMT